MKAKILFLIEVLAVATIFHLDYIRLLPVSKVPFLFLLGWISIRWRGLGWKDVDLTVNQPFLKLLAIGLAVGIAMEALELFATQPLLTSLLHKGPDLHEFQRLVGNIQLLILGIVLAWILAAFGEEMVYRGYLLNRVADLFGRSTIGWTASAVLVTLLFGVAHFPQGPTGIIENVIDGAILAALYFATGRNLIAPIIAHGIQDTVDVVLIYLGWYPGFQQSISMPS
jgi:hypothetical protein